MSWWFATDRTANGSKPPDFICEILSPSTAEKDKTAKRDRYAANGVMFYLLLDPDEKSGLLLELDETGTYREIPADSRIELHADCAIQLDIAAIFA